VRILLLRPPRYLWPFNSETSAFWQPLGLLCLAAAVRRDLPNAHVEVWDAPAAKMGWKTLAQRLAQTHLDVLGLGEETVSAHEALRAARLVKHLHPRCLVVAGGPYFAHALPESLADPAIDVIVRGEGEITLVELLRHLHDRSRWPEILGLAFRDDAGQLIRTPPRPLIDDLDSLPLPAWDLIDMTLYGRGARNHPDLASIEHSRGCIDSCNFCILWKHMGQSLNGNGRVAPRWRTKSPQRAFAEVHRLYHRYHRRTFGWVDPTFNVSPEWSDNWAELLLRSDLVSPQGPKTIHTAWLRADGVVRDEKHGVLAKLVRTGLRQVMIGIERDDDAGLAALGKHDNSWDLCRQAFAIFREKYPHVYTIGTLIFGLPADRLADLKRLLDCEYRLGADYCFLMPFTPNPGATLADAARSAGLIRNHRLASYNFHTPVCRTHSLSLRDLESIYWRIMFHPSPARLARTVRNLFTHPDSRKRRVHWALFQRGAGIALRSLARRLLHPLSQLPTLYSRRPSWYDH